MHSAQADQHPASRPPQARIRAVTALSLCDWPGRNASVLYLGGCNLACPTCHNASLAFAPQRHAVLDARAVLATLRARRGWLDAAVVCGGEPTLDPGLPDLVGSLQALGLKVKVDSNGMRPDVLADILARYPDTILAVDVKGPWRAYPELTGGAVTADEARHRLEAVFALATRSPASFLFRITTVPALTPACLAEARAQLPAGFALREQPYTPPPPFHPQEAGPAQGDARRTESAARNPAVAKTPIRVRIPERLARQDAPPRLENRPACDEAVVSAEETFPSNPRGLPSPAWPLAASLGQGEPLAAIAALNDLVQEAASVTRPASVVATTPPGDHAAASSSARSAHCARAARAAMLAKRLNLHPASGAPGTAEPGPASPAAPSISTPPPGPAPGV